MCGIIGYIGNRDTEPLLVDALKRLEYRGYDSCGIAVLDNGSSRRFRTAGRIQRLEDILGGAVSPGNGSLRCGIGHTRWATHGAPNDDNAHPHAGCSDDFLVAHNGIIENYGELRRRLAAAGHTFRSDTDSEVVPHLLEEYFEGNLEAAVRRVLQEIDGMYGLVAISSRDGYKLVAARRGAPLVVGLGERENFVASDAPALLPHTRNVLYLEDGEMTVVTADSVTVYGADGEPVQRHAQRIDWSPEMAEKQGYPHFMLKEIFEQPDAVRETLAGRVRRDGSTFPDELADLPDAAGIDRIQVVACGTSLHAGLAARFLFERLAGIPVDVDYASELRYRDAPLGDGTLLVAISQSGETADTLAALEACRDRCAGTLAVSNVFGSSIPRTCDAVAYTRAGIEIGVAATKTFVSQLALLSALALHLGRARGSLSDDAARRHAAGLLEVPDLMQRMLERAAEAELLAEWVAGLDDCLYVGRWINFPMAVEGALKLKEIAYIHAEGYAAGELKHGPIALIEPDMGTIAVAPNDLSYRKTLGNIEEIRVRGGQVLALATEGDEEIREICDRVLYLPRTEPLLSPFVSAVPLQLLAYHAGLLRGCDVDKPRNLAKSVTVE